MKTVRIKCLEYPLEGIYNSSLGKFVIYYDKSIPVVVKIKDVEYVLSDEHTRYYFQITIGLEQKHI